MATLEQIEAALRAADAAGNTEDAKRLAQAYAQMRGAQGQQPRADFSGVKSGVSSTDQLGPKKPSINPVVYALGQQNDLRQAATHHGMNALHGLAQTAQHGFQWGVNKLIDAPEAGQQPGLAQRFRQSVNDTVASDDAALARREAEYQARVPNTAGAYTGAAAGEILPWMVGVGELRAAGMLPKVKAFKDVSGFGASAANLGAKTGLLAGEGALTGLATPVIEGDFADKKAEQVGIGAVAAPLLGGLAYGGGKLATGLWGAGRYLFDGGRDTIANARLAKMLGSDPGAISTLEGASKVPGYQPTVAQAMPSPEALQAERILRNDPNAGLAFAAQDSSNNAALRTQAQRVAGTDADMQAAIAARKEATAPYITQMGQGMVDPTPILTELRRVAQSSLGVNPAVRKGLAAIEKDIKQRSSGGMIQGDVLDAIRQNAGDFIAQHANPSAPVGTKAEVALVPIKDQIAGAIDRAIPGYRDYLASYARLSQPINDMEAGRALVGAIDSGGRDAGGNQAVNLSAVRKILNADDKARYPMSPQARQQLEAVMEALQQRTVSNNKVAASGPGTAAEVRQGLLSSEMGRRAATTGSLLLGGMLGDTTGAIVGGLLAEGALGANRSVMKKVGQKAASAESAAAALRAHRAREADRRRGLIQNIPDYLLPYTTK